MVFSPHTCSATTYSHCIQQLGGLIMTALQGVTHTHTHYTHIHTLAIVLFFCLGIM